MVTVLLWVSVFFSLFAFLVLSPLCGMETEMGFIVSPLSFISVLSPPCGMVTEFPLEMPSWMLAMFWAHWVGWRRIKPKLSLTSKPEVLSPPCGMEALISLLGRMLVCFPLFQAHRVGWWLIQQWCYSQLFVVLSPPCGMETHLYRMFPDHHQALFSFLSSKPTGWDGDLEVINKYLSCNSAKF